MGTIYLEDEIVHYEVLGRGRPILFLHGWVGSYRYWIPSMQALCTHFRSFAIDYWGFGSSARIPTRYLLAEQKNLINQFMNEMEVDKFALVGHGLGAVISLIFANEFPDFVDRVMAVSLPLDSSAINPLLPKSSLHELTEWLLGQTNEAKAARLEALKADHNAVQRSFDNLRSINLSQLPQKIQAPCLIVNGVNDPAIKYPDDNVIKSLPPNFHIIPFTQSGHFPMIEQLIKFNRLLFDFLSLRSGRSPVELQLKEEWKRRLR
jgi:pimeloyl-ACP methyl ester carboxylesterase